MTPEELDALILGSMAGTLPEEDRRRLEAELAAAPEAARRFAELALQEGLLREMAGAELKSAERPRKIRKFRRPSTASAPLWLWAEAAAILVFAVAIALSLGRKGAEKPETAGAATPGKVEDSEVQPQDPPPPSPEPPSAPEKPPVDRQVIPPSMPSPIPEPQAPPRPEPPPPPPAPKPAPEVKPPAPAETRTAVARLEDVHGEVVVLSGSERLPAGGDLDLFEGQGVEAAGAESGTAVKFPDGTRLDLEAGASLLEVMERGEGKRARFERGRLSADVPRQPSGRPLVIATPHAEARVLGTRFTLLVEEESTRIEVREGKVRLTRRGGLAVVDVAAGHFAVAAAGTPLVSKPIPPEVVRVSFGPADAPLAPGFIRDDGSPWDEARGRGWSRDRRSSARLRPGAKESLLRQHVPAGSARSSDRWEIRLPEGKYHVAVCCGDTQYAQGPHRVVVEGLPVIRDVLTGAGDHVRGEGIAEVRDGRLTLELGAVGSTRTDPEGNSDTVLHYVVITRIR